MPRVKFVVEFELPEGVTIEEAQGYVSDAIQDWAGILGPYDPMYNLCYDTVEVTHQPYIHELKDD